MDSSNVCLVCYRRIQTFCYYLSCLNCVRRYHARCVNLDRDDIHNVSMWYCPKCVQTTLPFNHYDDDDEFYSAVIEGMLDCSFRFQEINNKVLIPFEINDTQHEMPMNEIDPDIQFYSNSQYTSNTKCNYYFEDSFKDCLRKNNIVSESKLPLSLFHMNIRSLPKHFDELEIYLNSLNHEFSFIGITESWLHKDNSELYGLSKYTSIDLYRNGIKGGGVSLYLRDSIMFKRRQDLEIFDSDLETIFIEIDKVNFDTKSNIIIGVVYRVPDSSVELFNNHISSIVETISKEGKLCYLMGDMNLDLIKHDIHKPTSSYLDIMYSNNFFPIITKPTRITTKTATLIDHIFTNNFDFQYQHIQGILQTGISDHYPIFHIAKNIEGSLEEQPYFLKRNISQKTICDFSDKISQVDWTFITEVEDAQIAYSLFHKKLSELYNLCFPYKKFNKKYNNRKPWLDLSLQESIKNKNKLFAKKKRGLNIKEKEVHYNKYRNKLHHLIRTAERKYYNNLILEHRSDLKKMWQVIKTVINKRKYSPPNSRFCHNGKIIEDKEEISNRFNHFFVNVGTSLASKIPSSNTNPASYIKVNISDSMFLDPVTESETEKLLKLLKDSSAGWDDIKPSLIKNIANDIKNH